VAQAEGFVKDRFSRLVLDGPGVWPQAAFLSGTPLRWIPDAAGPEFQMNRTLILAVGAVLLATADDELRAEKPNIVVIVADDLGWADVPWHGSKYRMPHVERLAQEGLRLESHDVHPVCSPTRAALLTGRYASRYNCTSPQNERVLRFGTVTLASALHSAGYRCALAGKWHLGSKPEWGPQHFGFDSSYGSLAGGCGPYDHRYKQGPYSVTWHRDGKLLQEQGHITDLIAAEAVRQIEHSDDRPLFLYVPFTAIHVPMDEPKRWLEANAHLSDPGQRLRAACASHLDDAVGRILAALQQKKLDENTLVIFFGDNGAHPPLDNQGGPYPGTYSHARVGNDNTPWRGHKGSVYEGGIRVPCVVRWTGRLKPGETHVPLHVVDWMPTLCRLAGADPGRDLKWDGRDIWPTLTGLEPAPPERDLYSAAPRMKARMVRHGRWKLVTTPANNPPEELFDLESDPGEQHNLAAAKPERLAEMKNRLSRIAAADGDAVPND
jgi:arylsulfatase A-like enzyme